MEVRCRIHKGSSTIPIFSQISPILVLISVFYVRYANVILHLCLGISRNLFSVGLSVTILKEPLLSSILATCSAHRNPLYLIILTKLSERFKLWSSLHSFKLNKSDLTVWFSTPLNLINQIYYSDSLHSQFS